MSRKVPEWIGKTDDTPVPPRVKLRVGDHYEWLCYCGCFTPISAADKIEFDHHVPLKLGGANRESNLRPYLKAHHAEKTKQDRARIAKTYRTRTGHLGLKNRSRRWGYGRGDPYRKKLTGEVVARRRKEMP